MTDVCRMIREHTKGCELVLLAATELEAAPVARSLIAPRRVEVAGKPVLVGELPLAARPDFESARVAPAAGEESVRVALAISGCDKANAAHILTCLLQGAETPRLVLQFGIAGALPLASGRAQPGDIVVATREIYGDTGTSSPEGWLSATDLDLPMGEANGRKLGNVFELNGTLVEVAVAALKGSGARAGSRVIAGPCVTVSRVSGLLVEGEELAARWQAVAESMEGAAAAHICVLYGIPFVEIRGISNTVEDRDRSSWLVDEAVEGAAAAVAAAAPALMARLASAAQRPPVGVE